MMKLKSVKLEWNVLYSDFNSKKIMKYNIFNEKIKENIYKEIKNKKIKSYDELKQYVENWARYHYWSKVECELAMGNLFGKYPDDFEKIDMFKQIEINLDRIIEYIINTMEIKF